jgi:hypothetical protein
VQPVAHVTEPSGDPAFTIFERTHAYAWYLFDGIYTAQASLACTPAGAPGACAALATNASCPSSDTLIVANDVVLDSCGYLRQSALTDDGAYKSLSTTYGIPVTGSFATAGTFNLSGGGAFGGHQYHLTLIVTKRN